MRDILPVKPPPLRKFQDTRDPVTLDTARREIRVGVVCPISFQEGLEEGGEVVLGPVSEHVLDLLDGLVVEPRTRSEQARGSSPLVGSLSCPQTNRIPGKRDLRSAIEGFSTSPLHHLGC
jgi:hypothetical protein